MKIVTTAFAAAVLVASLRPMLTLIGFAKMLESRINSQSNGKVIGARCRVKRKR